MRRHARFGAIRALVKKEAVQMVREPSSLTTAFILPFLLLFLLGSGFSLDLEGIPVGVLLEDSSPLARSLVHSLEQSKYLEVQVSRNRQDLEQRLAASLIRAFVVIPVQFSRDYESQTRSASIQYVGDGSEPNTARFAQQYVNGIVQTWQQQGKVRGPIGLEGRLWYNEELKSQWFIIPGSIVIIMTVIGALLTALVLAREWEQGTMESLMATPVTLFEIILSKFISYLALGIGSLTVCFIVATWIYQVPFRGSFLGLVTSSLAYLIFALEMGLLISSVTKNQFAASQAATISTYLPAFILSGFLFDIDSMPWILQMITKVVPARYFVTNLKTLFLVGDVWEILLPNILVMLAFDACLLSILVRRGGKRLDV